MNYSKNKTTLILLVFLLLLSFSKICSATMAASGPALNEKTKQCGGFYGGDEKKLYDIPEGWKVDFENEDVRKKFEQCGWYSGERNLKECCEQLNYNFIEGNIGNLPSKTRMHIILTLSIIIILIAVIWLLYLMFIKNQKKN